MEFSWRCFVVVSNEWRAAHSTTRLLLFLLSPLLSWSVLFFYVISLFLCFIYNNNEGYPIRVIVPGHVGLRKLFCPLKVVVVVIVNFDVCFFYCCCYCIIFMTILTNYFYYYKNQLVVGREEWLIRLGTHFNKKLQYLNNNE